MPKRVLYTEKELLWEIRKAELEAEKRRNRYANAMEKLRYWLMYLAKVAPDTYKRLEEQSREEELRSGGATDIPNTGNDNNNAG